MNKALWASIFIAQLGRLSASDQLPVYKNYYANLCRARLNAMGAQAPRVGKRTLIHALSLAQNNSFHRSAVAPPELSSHLVIESSREQLLGFRVESHSPRVEALVSPDLRGIPAPEANLLLAALNARAAGSYYEERLPGIDFSLGKMQLRRGFTEIPQLRAAAKNYLGQSQYVEVKTAPGDFAGIFRVIDAPYGLHWDYRIRDGLPVGAGNFGPTVAARELAPRDYYYYAFGINHASLTYTEQRLWNGGLIDEMFAAHPLEEDPAMTPHFLALGDYIEQHVGAATGIFNGAQRLMMEDLHREELLRAGFLGGLLPRLPYFTTYFFADNKYDRRAGIAREVGLLAIDEKLSPLERDQVMEILFVKFLALIFDGRETPFANLMGQIFYTYGNGVSRALYRDFGFTAMGPTITFNGKAADLLHATPIQIIEAYLKKYQQRHRFISREFEELLHEIQSDAQKVAPAAAHQYVNDVNRRMNIAIEVLQNRMREPHP